jgi:hypothetical protein
MRSRAFLGTLALFLTGCASGGPSSGPTSVRVYVRASDVPCRYEVIQTVRGQAMVTSYDEYARARDTQLGRGGLAWAPTRCSCPRGS